MHTPFKDGHATSQMLTPNTTFTILLQTYFLQTLSINTLPSIPVPEAESQALILDYFATTFVVHL